MDEDSGPSKGDRADTPRSESEGEGEPAAAPPPPRITGVLYLLVGTSATMLATGGVIYLLYLGDRGNTIAGPLALLVAFVTLVVTLLLYLASRGFIQIRPGLRLRRALQSFAVCFSIGAFASALALLGVAFTDKQIPITELIQRTGAKKVADGSIVTVEIPEPTRRSGLTLTPRLTSLNPAVGNCEGSAVLTLTTRIDGVERARISNQRPGREVRMSLRDAQRTAAVDVMVHFPRDSTCAAELSVSEAFLYTQED